MPKTPVIALGFDAADPQLLETWMAAGLLPTFKQLQEQGSYGRLHNTVNYCGMPAETASTEALWPAFITGRRASTTGFWDIVKFYPDRYDVSCDLEDPGFDYSTYPPFYALGDRYKVAVFDLPYAKLFDQVNGIQVLGWGGTYPYTPRASHPDHLYSQLTETYGKNPIIFNDNGIWWDEAYVAWEKQALQTSIEGRTAICCDLLQRDTWDLFLTTFNETHTAGHDLYDRSDPAHPLYGRRGHQETTDPLLETYQAIDRAVARILTCAPRNAYVVLFSPHGMGLNYSDLMSQTFLPEVLYRFNFPGKAAIIPGDSAVPPPEVIRDPKRNSWPGEVWARSHTTNPLFKCLRYWTPSQLLRNPQNGMASPYVLMDQSVPMGWMPVMWCQPLWPQMKAFALPGFADGHIRINLKGRERDGIVLESDYDALCNQLTEVLYRLKDARTGQPVVKQVLRSRLSPLANDPSLPDFDLCVIWHEHMTDVVDSPDFGRIGPVPYFRAGSHWERGFFLATGPGIPAGTTIETAEFVDLPPTILTLLDAPMPTSLEGRPLLHPTAATVEL